MPNELELWKGEVGFPRPDWEFPREGPVEAEGSVEGKFRDLPEEEDLWSGTEGDEEEGLGQEYLESMRRKAAEYGVKGPETYKEAREFELFLPRLEKKAEVEELERKARLEEAKTRMSALRAARPTRLQKFLKGVGKTWKGTKEVAGPRRRVSGEWYIPKANRELYVPGTPGWRPTTEQVPAGEAHRPELSTLRRAGSPPPSTPVKAPFRGIERFEGLGTAMSRLRGLEKFPEVDQAVYQEIHANGDIDTPTHVRKEVGQLGFSRREIDSSLKRLRDLGLLVPTGNKWQGEQELMVAGGTNHG